jgi:hypothetical protein
LFVCSFKSLGNFDQTLQRGQQLMRNCTAVNLQHPIVSLELGVFFQFANISENQHCTLLILVEQVLHTDLDIDDSLVFVLSRV